MEDKYFSIKHRFAFGAAVAAFFTSTLLIYAPLSLYVSGNDEMWFSFRSLLSPVFVVSLLGMIVMTALLSLPKRGIHKILCCLVFGVSLGLYIQCGFFNISYGSGVLDGSQIAWKDYTTYGAIDSAMWAACLALPFAIYMVFKRSWRHILMVSAIFIILLQIGGLSVNLYQNQNSLNKLSHEVTVDGIYELSEDDNTLVFMLGSMDKSYFDEYKENHPEIEEELTGFTEYDNALSTGSDSLVSVPAMLTGDVYKKDTKYTEYVNGAWSSSNAFDVLQKNNADARVYSDDKYFGNAAVRKVENIVDRAQDSEAYWVIGSTIYRYTMYKAVPHYLKQLFWMSLNDYSSFKSNSTYNPDNDEKFFSDYDEAEGFTYTDEYPSAVRVYNLKGAEAPYRLTSTGEKDTDGTSLEEQVEGDFCYILKMIGDLKENGKYDDARIIITADCGDTEYNQRPVLLYKDKGDKEAYRTSSAPVSLFDLPATLASTVTDDYKDIGTGKTFKDDENAAWNRRRFFYLNTGSNAKSRIEEYKTNSPKIEADDLKLVNSYYINGGKVDNYILGTELTFTEDETAAMYCQEGFGHTNGWRTIINGKEAVMEIPIEDIPENLEDLHAYFNVLNIYEEKQCVITANGEEVYSGRLTSDVRKNGLNFLIPTNVIGRDKTVRLTFSFPELSEDTDVMALTSFKIYKQ
ncbi:MAG: hypothetical protein IJH40_04340 [Ruminococcus sp.]|uniref:hypothetical protein n=1 Tax=Ruminococcus sp. TaxID=41978 RepID=UPI0028731E06|nr:hypothetical protein [Ruminococcus sp.]MBQ3284853.1 hypothetical protein [Ruminococcus sp.]